MKTENQSKKSKYLCKIQNRKLAIYIAFTFFEIDLDYFYLVTSN